MTDRLPPWFKQDLPSGLTLARMRSLKESSVNTVCKSALCPNLGKCFDKRQLTFMILGDTCTRSCSFCAVKKSGALSLTLDLDEPQRITATAKRLGLDYVVVTSVTRDDLEDGGAGIFAETIKLIHALGKDIKVEVLIPDFGGKFRSLSRVLEALPDLVAHNIETVPRLYPDVRAGSDYRISLGLLAKIKELAPLLLTKSSIMLGMGEEEEEIKEAMRDLRAVGCDILTLGQYLAPSNRHYPVKVYIAPAKFLEYKEIALDMGFKAVLSGPLVRSSYQAQELYNSSTVGSYA